MSKYPIGATWKGTNEKGNYIFIWLDERLTPIEIWRWQYYFSNETSKYEFYYGDWNTSYKKCYEECAYMLTINGNIPKFKRIK